MKSRILRRYAALFMVVILLLPGLACTGLRMETTTPVNSGTDYGTPLESGTSSVEQQSIIDNTTTPEPTTPEPTTPEPTTPEQTTPEQTTPEPTTPEPTTPEPTTPEPTTPEPTTPEPTTPEPTTQEPTTPEPTTPEPTTSEPTTPEPTTPEPTTPEPTTPEPTTPPLIVEPNMPIVVAGEIKEATASGTKVFEQNGATIDYSNTEDGYVMIKMTGAHANLKVRIIYQDGTTYDYDLNMNDIFEVYSLQSGSGTYTVGVYQNNGSGRYFQVLAITINASMTNENNPYLMPSQRVYYTHESDSVQKSFELCATAETDEEKVTAVYNYIVTNVKYDYDKAASVGTNYVSSADSTLQTNKGICLDYAVLMAAMLRVQGIPTQVVYGSATGASWHAWNKVYYNGRWVLLDATFAAGGATGQNYIEVKRY